MKLRVLVGFMSLLTLTGCQGMGTGMGSGGGWGPRIVEGNPAYVVVMDEFGFNDKQYYLASMHCATHKKIASYRGHGGNNWECSGRMSQLCTIYDCVKQ